MRSSLVIVIFILPYAIVALYDDNTPQQIKLEDIEEEHVQSERQSKATLPESLPPPLSQQPAKGQQMQRYPPITDDHIQEFDRANPSIIHPGVQPLTDQPSAPEADYQQSTAFQRETIVYIPPSAHGHRNSLQPQYDIVPQQQQQQLHQPQQQPIFYYSHDIQQPQHQLPEDGYQLQFVPIDQHEESLGQRTYTRPHEAEAQVQTVPFSYSHDADFDVLQQSVQPQKSVKYATSNEIREPNNAQQVYGLQANGLFRSEKDIEYAQQTETYGPPPRSHQPYANPHKETKYSQQIVLPTPSPTYGPHQPYANSYKETKYSQQNLLPTPSPTYEPQRPYKNQDKTIQYSTKGSSPSTESPEPAYGTPEYFSLQKDTEYTLKKSRENFQTSTESSPAVGTRQKETRQPTEKPLPIYGTPEYFSRQKEIEYTLKNARENGLKHAITYGPPANVGQVPHIQYGSPDAPFRRPLSQSNQNTYAPRRPDSSARSNGKQFQVSFPYPPSFVSITTKRPNYEKSASNPEYNDVSPWRPLNPVPSQQQYRSFSPSPTPSPRVIPNIEPQLEPLIDFFNSRSAKSLIDSYIPSWLIARMQEEHAYRLQQQQAYSVPSPASEDGYNTIAYSTQYDDNFGKSFRSSIQRIKRHAKKKA